MGTNIIPPFDQKSIAGGFIARVFDNLPKPFSPNPKAKSALILTPNDSMGRCNYLTITDGKFTLHNMPYNTPGYTPEHEAALGAYTIDGLAAAINAFDCGYTATSLGKQDGSSSVMLLGMMDFPLNMTDTLELQIATSRLWKYLYPIAQVLYAAERDSQTGEDELYMPFATGFWLDFWGDWFKIPRLPGMDDLGYVSYLMRNLRTPKGNNMAIEDILTAKYNVPAKVEDSGYKQFTATLDASVMSVSAADIAPLINQVKSAGTKWLLAYYSKNAENFKAYFYDKHGGQSFENADAMNMAITLFEEKYGYSPIVGFMFNNDTMNNGLPSGETRKIKDTLSLMSYLIQQVESRPTQSTGELLKSIDFTWRPAETYVKKANAEAVNSVTLSMREDRYGYRVSTGFAFNDGTFNNDDLGGGLLLKDVMSAISVAWNLSETRRAIVESFTVPSIIWSPAETWTRKQEVLGTVVMGTAEGAYGYNTESGFMFGTGTFNNDVTGGGRRIKDTYTMAYS